jgi:hypothetical protein
MRVDERGTGARVRGVKGGGEDSEVDGGRMEGWVNVIGSDSMLRAGGAARGSDC